MKDLRYYKTEKIDNLTVQIVPCFTVASVALSEKSLASKLWVVFACYLVCKCSDLFFSPKKPVMEFSFMYSGPNLCREQLLIAVSPSLGAGSTAV